MYSGRGLKNSMNKKEPVLLSMHRLARSGSAAGVARSGSTAARPSATRNYVLLYYDNDPETSIGPLSNLFIYYNVFVLCLAVQQLLTARYSY